MSLNPFQNGSPGLGCSQATVTGLPRIGHCARILTLLAPHHSMALTANDLSRSFSATSRASLFGNSLIDGVLVSFRRAPVVLDDGPPEAAILPMTRGTNVSNDFPRNDLISIARTSIWGIWAFRNSTTCSRESGISSATNSRRKRHAARFVATVSQKTSKSVSLCAPNSFVISTQGSKSLA